METKVVIETGRAIVQSGAANAAGKFVIETGKVALKWAGKGLKVGTGVASFVCGFKLASRVWPHVFTKSAEVMDNLEDKFKEDMEKQTSQPTAEDNVEPVQG